MQVIKMKITDLKPYEKNAKLHPDKQINQIAESIKKFGMNDPIGIWGKQNLILYSPLLLFLISNMLNIVHVLPLLDFVFPIYL